METLNIKERIDDLELDENTSYSSFYLVTFDKDNLFEPIEVLPIENGSKDLAFNGSITLLTDRDGNVLRTFYKDNVKVLLVNKGDIVIEEDKEEPRKVGTKLVIDTITRYGINHFDHKLSKEEVLYDSKNNFWCEITIPNTESNLLLIKKSNRNGRTSKLYSLDRKEYITPDFYGLEPVVNRGKTVFKYKDFVKSNETINDKPMISSFEGFIDENGIFADQIYFDHSNKVKDVALNDHDNFLQYRALKRLLAIELDAAVEERIDKIHLKRSKIRRMEHDFIYEKKDSSNC